MAGELYRLANGTTEGSFVITKYDHIGFEVLSNYHMADAITCECPAGHRPSCRHRQMLPAMLDGIDTERFYRFDDGKWFQFVDGTLTAVKTPEFLPFGKAAPEVIRPEAPVEGTEHIPENVVSFRRRF